MSLLSLSLWACSGGRPPEAAWEAVKLTQETAIDEQLVARPLLGPDGQPLPDAVVVTDTWYHDSNVLVVRMPDGTVVISSSPFETGGARKLLGWVQQTFAPEALVAINPHFHFDGTGGNAAYREAGATIWASDQTARKLANEGEALRDTVVESLPEPWQKEAVQRLELVLPTEFFPAAEGLVLTFGGEEVRVVYPGPAHSPDNVVVHFPSRGLLFGGCMIKVGGSLGYLGDADVGAWDEAIRVLEPLQPQIVVPGHGPVGDGGLLAHTLSLVEAANAAAPSEAQAPEPAAPPAPQ